MLKDFINDSDHWHRRAQEARELAKRGATMRREEDCPQSQRSLTGSDCVWATG
jgi:hypothetical protein